MVVQLLSTITRLNPDIVLLGGDYVDSRGGWEHLTKFVNGLSERAHVYAIAGNHDYWLRISRLKALFASNRIPFLETESILFSLSGTSFKLDANQPKNSNGSEMNLLCLHKPIDIRPFAANYQLVVAGHLHGGQVVIWENERGLYPGRLFYKWNRLEVDQSGCPYFISKGLGDTLPIRYNCPKDVLLIHLTPQDKRPIRNHTTL